MLRPYEERVPLKKVTFGLLKGCRCGTTMTSYDDMAGLEDAGGTNFGSALSGLAVTPALAVFTYRRS
jgi:hypothetical protein